MLPNPALLTLAHLIGLSLAVGAATVKLTLLLMSGKDATLVPIFLRIARPVTKLIIMGMVLLTLSGIGWLLLGHSFTPLLIVKLVLFGAVWVIGPIIDNVAEPRFRTLAPAAGQQASPEFLGARSRYLTLEVVATGLFFIIVALWVLGS